MSKVNSWRHRTKRLIACLKNLIRHAAVGETFFVHNNSAGRKSGPMNTGKVSHAGGCRKRTVFGAVEDNERQFFRTSI